MPALSPAELAARLPYYLHRLILRLGEPREWHTLRWYLRRGYVPKRAGWDGNAMCDAARDQLAREGKIFRRPERVLGPDGAAQTRWLWYAKPLTEPPPTRPPLTDTQIRERLLALVRETPGQAWRVLRRQLFTHGKTRADKARDELVREGLIQPRQVSYVNTCGITRVRDGWFAADDAATIPTVLTVPTALTVPTTYRGKLLDLVAPPAKDADDLALLLALVESMPRATWCELRAAAPISTARADKARDALLAQGRIKLERIRLTDTLGRKRWFDRLVAV